LILLAKNAQKLCISPRVYVSTIVDDGVEIAKLV